MFSISIGLNKPLAIKKSEFVWLQALLKFGRASLSNSTYDSESAWAASYHQSQSQSLSNRTEQINGLLKQQRSFKGEVPMGRCGSPSTMFIVLPCKAPEGYELETSPRPCGGSSSWWALSLAMLMVALSLYNGHDRTTIYYYFFPRMDDCRNDRCFYGSLCIWKIVVWRGYKTFLVGFTGYLV